MMKIVIDGRMINESGIGRYLRNLIFHLQKIDNGNDYYILYLKNEYDRLVYHTRGFHKVLANFRWYTLEEQIRLPRILREINADLVHFPHFNIPLFYNGKFVVTIHDLIHQHYKLDRATLHNPFTYKVKHLGYKRVFKKAVIDSMKILTPSEFVKKQLVDEWKIERSKLIVTPEAVEDKLVTIANNLSQDQEKRILKKFSVKSPYIFYVGNAHPHKNVEGLIEAFKKVKDSGVAGASQNDKVGLQLVLAGNDNYFWQKIKEKYNMDSRLPSATSATLSTSSLRTSRGNDSVVKDIIFTGNVSDEELVVLYKNACVFVMPSFEEGFGIPILEAMAMGCSVVSSSTGSLKEVGGDAAIYFDPHDQEDMVNKIDMVLKSETLREELIKKGKQRVKKFSWKKMVEETLEVYKNACSYSS